MPTRNNIKPSGMESLLFQENGSGLEVLSPTHRYQATGIPQILFEATSKEKREDGTNNLVHCIGVLNILETHTNMLITDATVMGVLMHDQIFQRQNRPAKKDALSGQLELSNLTPDIIDLLINYATSDVPAEEEFARDLVVDEILYGLGIAISSQMWEVGGENWRGLVREHFVNTNASQIGFIEEHLQKVYEKHGYFKPQKKRQYRDRILEGLTDGGAKVTQDMLDFRAPGADVKQVLNDYYYYDVEGLVIKAAEIVYNLEHPNPKRPASAWRDAQELRALYGPILDFLRFDDLASLCFDTADRYLNQNSRYLKTAEDLNRRASELWSLDGGVRVEIINGMQQTDQSGKTKFIVTEERVKRVGSIVAKMEEGRGSPDTIAFRAIIDPLREQPKATDWVSFEWSIEGYIFDLIGIMEQQGFILGDNRELEKNAKERKQPIEIRWKGVNKESVAIAKSMNRGAYKYELKPPSVDGYEGIHVTFYNKNDPSIGLEVQLFTPDQEKKRKEIAHHGFFKARYSAGAGGDARRNFERVRANTTPTIDSSAYKGAYMEYRRALLALLLNPGGYLDRISRFAGGINEFQLRLSKQPILDLANVFGSILDPLYYRLLDICPELRDAEDWPIDEI